MNGPSRSGVVRLTGSALLWVFGAGSVLLAYENVILRRFSWPRGGRFGSYLGQVHGDCPNPPG